MSRSQDTLIYKRLGELQQQLGNIQQSLADIQQELRRRKSRSPTLTVYRRASALKPRVKRRSLKLSPSHDSGNGTAESSVSDTDGPSSSHSRTNHDQKSGSGIPHTDQPSKRNLSKTTVEVVIWTRKGVGKDAAKRGHIEDVFSDAIESSPKKKRKLIQLSASERATSADVDPPDFQRLRRLAKGRVRPGPALKPKEDESWDSLSTDEEDTSDASSQRKILMKNSRERSDSIVTLPPQFSRANSEPLSHHFKIVCQLFAILVLDPVADRRITMQNAMKGHYSYFQIAIQKMRGALSGLRDSLVKSQAWRPAFTHALQTYPILEIEVLKVTADGCEACHLSGRKSSRLAIFSGEPYDKVTFEPTANDQGEAEHESASNIEFSGVASSNEAEDTDEQTEDADAETSTDSKEVEGQKRFAIGRYCARRSEVFHELTHWEIILFKDISSEIEQRPADLTKPADIGDWLVEQGMVQMAWQSIAGLMERSRNLEIDGKKDDDDINFE